MAIISGTTVAWQLSPRIITIPAPITEITIEDLQDTLLDLEQTEQGIVWPHLRNLSGGENLGGGTSVGFTMELQNAQIAFEARVNPKESGTATSTGTNTLIDSTASFITNGVIPGAFIVNYDDKSFTTVISVDSETQITHQLLQKGSNNDWTIGDTYTVTNEIQCQVSGGNLVAVDTGGLEISPIFATVGTQILKTSSSSATTQNQESLEFSSFAGGVAIDTVNGTAGTEFPQGTREYPVNSIADAETIEHTRGLNKYFVLSSITLGSGDDFGGEFHIIEGDSPTGSAITINAGANIPNIDWRNVYLNGILGLNSIIRESIIGSVTDANGFIYNCALIGPIVINNDLNIQGTWNAPAVGDNEVIIDFNSLANTVSISGCQGNRFLFKNMVSGSELFIYGNAHVRFDNTNTTGHWHIYGGINIHDESGATWEVAENSTIANKASEYLERAVWIDTEQIAAGDGSQSNPFNNLTIAIDFAAQEGINTLYVYADIVLDRQLKNFKIVGIGTPTIDCNGQNLNKSEFWHCKMQGTYTGEIVVQQSVLLNNFELNGFFEKNALAGDLICIDGSSVFMLGNSSAIPGLGRPTISMNGSGSSSLNIRDNNGGLTIKDCNNILDKITVEVNVGSLTFDSSNTAGEMVARGSGKFVDNSAGATVVNEMQSSINVQHPVEGTYTLEEVMRLMSAALAGKLSETGNIVTIRDINDTKDRIIATTDTNGQRTAITLDAT